MKIAILGPAYPYRGGISNFSERLAQELLTKGDEVHLYTFKMMYPDFVFPGKTQYAETPLQFPLKITRNINSMNPFNWLFVGKKIKQQEFDIIFVAYSIPFLGPCLGFISRVAKHKKTKVISIIHNLNPHEKRIGDSLLSKYFLNSCDFHLALSEKVKSEVEIMDTKHSTMFSPLPVYDTFGTLLPKKETIQQLHLDTTNQFILFFGLVRHYKGLDLLIDAMKFVHNKNSNIKLIIAGEFYEDIQTFKQQIEKYQLEENIILYNKFIPENEVNLYFSAADVVVQPYRHATQSAVTQVCYHFNKPMIVTNVGGLPETVPDNIVGYVCEPNPESIATAILKFYAENKEQEFIDNVKIEKQKYSWSKLVENIKSLVLS